jgi:hypothetical protein
MRRRRRHRSLGLAGDGWLLGLEAATVVGLRGLKIAAGGRAAKTEARRMVSEKLDAALAWQTLALTGGLGLTASSAASKTLRHYRRKVRGNRRRLAKP